MFSTQKCEKKKTKNTARNLKKTFRCRSMRLIKDVSHLRMNVYCGVLMHVKSCAGLSASPSRCRRPLGHPAGQHRAGVHGGDGQRSDPGALLSVQTVCRQRCGEGAVQQGDRPVSLRHADQSNVLQHHATSIEYLLKLYITRIFGGTLLLA